MTLVLTEWLAWNDILNAVTFKCQRFFLHSSVQSVLAVIA